MSDHRNASDRSTGPRWTAARRRLLAGAALATLLAPFAERPAAAQGQIYFHAEEAEAGSVYRRVASPRNALFDQLKEEGVLTPFTLPMTPLKPYGAPGVAIFDYDGDGDLDVFATNGPGADNTLLVNQLAETGRFALVDGAAAAGVGAFADEGSGVCFGDTDNDGDRDLLVLSLTGPNRFFENNGDGTFTDVSFASGLGEGERASTSCSFGDVDGDGLLDVVVANCCNDVTTQAAIFLHPFDYSQHNQLYRNLGGNVFEDVSAGSGIEDHRGFPPGFEGSPTLTWAISMVDYDQDGDVDIFTADDQAGTPPAADGGIDRGLLHLFENDGTGRFTDVVVERGLDKFGLWMGLSFGDVNGDGHLDVFATNGGDWGGTILSALDPVYGAFLNVTEGRFSSRWFLGSASGAFSDPGVGDLRGTPFGWGTSMTDYDNDGDVDVLFHGGNDSGLVVHTAPAAVLRNLGGTGGDARFERDAHAFTTVDHERRVVHGMAVGDLNDDGFVDVVSASSFDIPPDARMAPYRHEWGSPFDGGRYSPTYLPTEEPGVWTYGGVEYDEGTLVVEVSSADNGYGWAKVRLRGAAGLLPGGRSNRDGIGAVVSFETGEHRATLPVSGGASYASQDSLELVFGLGHERQGRLEVLWPGGTRNRLYGVRPGERIVFPEIPCSFDQDWPHPLAYAGCVRAALDGLSAAGALEAHLKPRLMASAVRAYFEERR